MADQWPQRAAKVADTANLRVRFITFASAGTRGSTSFAMIAIGLRFLKLVGDIQSA